MEIDQSFIREAIKLADQAKESGNHPFGALLVIDEKVILKAQNTVNSDTNPTSHAETNLVQLAIQQLTKQQLASAILYTSCEPCAMCSGAIYWSGIRKVIYALSTEELGRMAGGDMNISCREIFARTRENVEVVGPLLIDEARKAHEEFWRTGEA
jgi:tRNA(Arg) A34 adenosine deaminase TadA